MVITTYHNQVDPGEEIATQVHSNCPTIFPNLSSTITIFTKIIKGTKKQKVSIKKSELKEQVFQVA